MNIDIDPSDDVDRLYVQPETDGELERVRELDDELRELEVVDLVWWTFDVPPESTLDDPLDVQERALVASFAR